MMKKIIATILLLFFLGTSGCATTQSSKAKADAEELTQTWLSMIGEGEPIESPQTADFNKELEPENSVAYNNRGVAYFAQEEYQKALDDFNKAIELDPEYANPYFFRGYYYHMKEAYESAVDNYNRARRLNPKIDIARIMLNEIVKKTAVVEPGDGEEDDNDKVECRWIKPIPFRKSVDCRTKKEWAKSPDRSKWVVRTTPSFPPHEGTNQTMSPGEARDIYYGR